MSRAPTFSDVDSVPEAEVAAARGARDAGIALLARAVEVARPGQGKALLGIVGRVSTASFLGGVLEVRIQPDADWSMIDLFVDTGAEVTRLTQTLLSSVPFTELSKVAETCPPLALAGGASTRRMRLRGPEPTEESSPESDLLAAALVFPEPPTRKKSVPATNAISPNKPNPPPPRPTPSPGAVPARRVAPSDVKATVRADAAPKRPSSAPRAPRPDVKATIKVESVHIPKEAIGGKKAVAPPRELLRKVDRTSALIPRDEDE